MRLDTLRTVEAADVEGCPARPEGVRENRDVEPVDDLSIEEAAVELGMSPSAVISLLESGQLPSHLGPDGRRRRVGRDDLARHRDERFALRQQLVQEQRARRWADTTAEPLDDLPDLTG